MSPLLIALGLVGGAVLVAALARAGSARGQPRRTALVWGCGGTRLSPRMEYTATSYAEPLTRVFDDVLRPEHDVDVTHHAESRYLVESVRYRQRVADRIEARLYPPLLAAAPGGASGRAACRTAACTATWPTDWSACSVVLIAVGVTA